MALLELNLLRPEQRHNKLRTSTSDFDILKVNQIQKSLSSVQSRLDSLADRQLIELAVRAQYAERCAFILRGMCAFELRRRVALRLRGGRGKRDRAKIGVGAQVAELAKRININPTTLLNDARIYKTFFASMSDTLLAREHTLAREFYVIALSANDPSEAIKYAIERSSNSSFSRSDFREYVRTLKRNSCLTSKHIQKTYTLRVSISLEVQNALNEIIEITGRSSEAIITEMILARHKALPRLETARNVEASSGRPHANRDFNEQSSPQLTLMPVQNLSVEQ